MIRPVPRPAVAVDRGPGRNVPGGCDRSPAQSIAKRRPAYFSATARWSARSRTGVTDEELDELLFQIAAYCGVPTGIAAKRVVAGLRKQEADDVESAS